MTEQQLIATLAAKVGNLPVYSQDFANSLVTQFNNRGYLSDKQWPWVTRLIERAEGKTESRTVELDGAALVAFMDRAADAGLKYPKIKLSCNGEPLVISRAGSRSKAPGSLTVTDGGPFGDNVYYGRVARDGTFTPARACTDDHIKVLQALATKPAETAAAYGQRTGSCCFCRRHLEDYRSVTVGYGPVCADKYGLPWGEVAEGLSEYSENVDSLGNELGFEPGPEHCKHPQRDIYGEPPWSEDRITFPPQDI